MEICHLNVRRDLARAVQGASTFSRYRREIDHNAHAQPSSSTGCMAFPRANATCADELRGAKVQLTADDRPLSGFPRLHPLRSAHVFTPISSYSVQLSVILNQNCTHTTTKHKAAVTTSDGGCVPLFPTLLEQMLPTRRHRQSPPCDAPSYATFVTPMLRFPTLERRHW